MDAELYFKTKARMTKMRRDETCSIECEECPLSIENNKYDILCSRFEKKYPDKAGKPVLDCLAKNPVKTNRGKFMEMFSGWNDWRDLFADCCYGNCKSDSLPCSICGWWYVPYQEKDNER